VPFKKSEIRMCDSFLSFVIVKPWYRLKTHACSFHSTHAPHCLIKEEPQPGAAVFHLNIFSISSRLCRLTVGSRPHLFREKNARILPMSLICLS